MLIAPTIIGHHKNIRSMEANDMTRREAAASGRRKKAVAALAALIADFATAMPHVREQISVWGRLIRETGIKPE